MYGEHDLSGLFVCGGNDKNVVQLYNFDKDEWSTIGLLPKTHQKSNLTILNYKNK